EVGPVPGAVGVAYLITLGVALVYLGEHYAADLLGGALLTEAVQLSAPRLVPVARALAARLESLAADG
ncbi:MAG TPA: phosphoesterase, partial [Solirubrobacteraceae bacterium]|nr:phosphoesterase [Solirubrobacteraceae bacterium]